MSNLQGTLPPQRPVIDINFIEQRDNEDCVIACIAMVCGVSYDAVKDIVVRSGAEIPVTEFNEFCLLAHFQHLPLRSIENTIYSDRAYLITVPSLNIPARHHRIVVTTYNDGDIVVYDPNSTKENKKSYCAKNLKSWADVTEIVRCTK